MHFKKSLSEESRVLLSILLEDVLWSPGKGCAQSQGHQLWFGKILLYHIKHTKDVIVLSAWFIFWDTESRITPIVYRK